MKALACMLVLVIAVLSHATSASAAIIYSDDFSGSSGANLNGTAPDVRPGTQTWTAATAIKADGSVSGVGHASAYLPFNPVAGNVYTMSVDVNVTGGTGGNWFALGFAADDEIFGWHSTAPTPLLGSWQDIRDKAIRNHSSDRILAAMPIMQQSPTAT